MTVSEIANRLVELCRQGQFETAQNELYAENCVSIEGERTQNAKVEGLEAIRVKGKEFQSQIEKVYSMEVSEPLVAGNYFTLVQAMELEFKGMGRITMSEVSVYKVDEGKIVLEQFFF